MNNEKKTSPVPAGKKFGADFERIDEVKPADKILVEDSGDGRVKYATPSQINALFDKLVADIEAATKAAAAAAASQEAAAGSAGGASTSASTATTKAEEAAAAQKAAAQSAAAAAATLENAVQKDGDETSVIAHAFAAVIRRLATLEDFVHGIASGRVIVEKLSVDDLQVNKANNIVTNGVGAPARAPYDKGRIYIDTENDVVYKSKDNKSVSDWSNK